MKLKYILISIISGFIFTIFIYNINIETRIIRYSYISIFYLLLYLFINTKCNNKNPIFILLITTSMPIIIDASVFFTFPEMIPLRFPFSSIFPIIGALTSQLIISRKYKMLLIFTPVIIVFFYISHAFIIPQLIFQITLKNEKKTNYQTIFNATFIDAAGKHYKLDDISNKNCKLIECYFVGCPPCEQKEIELIKLDSIFKNKSFSIIRICSGVVTNYETFKKNTVGKKGIYLYDNDSLLYKSYHLLGYPFELIADRNYIKTTVNGFDKTTSDVYLNNEIKTINNIIK